MMSTKIAALTAIAMMYAAGSAAGAIIIDADAMTITGDGDGDPNAFKGTPLFTQVVGGVSKFYVAGNLHLADGEVLRGVGSRPASMVVGGNAVVADGATIDFSAIGTQAVAGGGLSGSGGTGGGGGAGGAHPVDIDGYRAGGEGGAGGWGGSSMPRTGGGPTIGYFGTVGAGGYAGEAGGFASHGGDGGFGFNSASLSVLGGDAGGRASTTPAPSAGGSAGHPGAVKWFLYGLGENPEETLLNATPGGVGSEGQPGGNGQEGRPGRGGVHDPATGAMLVGGGGGSGGGGGGSGAGGSSGAGGGGGGGGANSGDAEPGPGDAGDGGKGGWGGAGGHGGAGGLGGAGGAGGGGFELHVYGRASIHGALLARGGDGQPGQSGESGTPGAPGRDGAAGHSHSRAAVPELDGDDGANGGYGGAGGDGGRGGDGGTGGGGAGGTIMLLASQLEVHGSGRLDTAGGNSTAADPTAGQAGRVLLGSNLPPAVQADVVASSTATIAGPKNLNPFASWSIDVGGTSIPLVENHTPRMVDLVGGAEAYGVHAAHTADSLTGQLGASVQTARDAGHVALLLKLFSTTELAGGEHAGHSVFALINLADEPLENPSLKLTPLTPASPLKIGGWMNDPAFGGGGEQTLLQLDPGAIYLTLIPEALATGGEAEIGWGGRRWHADWSGTAGQDFAIGIGAVPEPTSVGLALAGLAAMIAGRRGARRAGPRPR